MTAWLLEMGPKRGNAANLNTVKTMGREVMTAVLVSCQAGGGTEAN